MIKKLFNTIVAEKQTEHQAELYRNLIRHEAHIGGGVFGPTTEGTRREFFCLDSNTWIWHEEWIDEQGSHCVKTTRYDVRPNGIMKAQDGQPYSRISKQEAMHLRDAAIVYKQRVFAELYDHVAQKMKQKSGA